MSESVGRGARLVVSEQVSHQPPDGDALAISQPFGRWLETDEQPFCRRFVANPEWQSLPCGWLTATSQLHLLNEPPKFGPTQPTAAQRADSEARHVEVGLSMADCVVPFAVVRPGETCRFEPAALHVLRVRCSLGLARCILTLIPQ